MSTPEIVKKELKELLEKQKDLLKLAQNNKDILEYG
jgi:hypothetical protein